MTNNGKALVVFFSHAGENYSVGNIEVYAPFSRGILATTKGLEPSTSGVTGRRSNRLSYSAMVMWL